MTIVQKILARATGQVRVEVGDIVEPVVDLAMSHENAALVINQFREIYEGTGREPRVWDPARIGCILLLQLRREAEMSLARSVLLTQILLRLRNVRENHKRQREVFCIF